MLRELWLIVEWTPDKDASSLEVMLTDSLTLAFSTLYWVGTIGLISWVVQSVG